MLTCNVEGSVGAPGDAECVGGDAPVHTRVLDHGAQQEQRPVRQQHPCRGIDVDGAAVAVPLHHGVIIRGAAVEGDRVASHHSRGKWVHRDGGWGRGG